MTSGGPRSVKGLDPQARAILQDLARREGLTTADLLQRLMAEEGPEEARSGQGRLDFPQQINVVHGDEQGRRGEEQHQGAPGNKARTLDRIRLFGAPPTAEDRQNEGADDRRKCEVLLGHPPLTLIGR